MHRSRAREEAEQNGEESMERIFRKRKEKKKATTQTERERGNIVCVKVGCFVE